MFCGARPDFYDNCKIAFSAFVQNAEGTLWIVQTPFGAMYNCYFAWEGPFPGASPALSSVPPPAVREDPPPAEKEFTDGSILPPCFRARFMVSYSQQRKYDEGE